MEATPTVQIDLANDEAMLFLVQTEEASYSGWLYVTRADAVDWGLQACWHLLYMDNVVEVGLHPKYNAAHFEAARRLLWASPLADRPKYLPPADNRTMKQMLADSIRKQETYLTPEIQRTGTILPMNVHVVRTIVMWTWY